MTVSTFTQPDYTSPAQTGGIYPRAIDAAIQVHDRIAGPFACNMVYEGSPAAAAMAVIVRPGAVPRSGLVPLEVAEQRLDDWTPPVGNPRHDVIFIDYATGTAGAVTGLEAASPADPALPAGKTAIARLRWFVGMTEITNADIDDLRVGGLAPVFTGPDVAGSPQLPGTAGLAPPPQPGDEGNFLRGDAAWAPVVDDLARNGAAAAMAVANATGIAGQLGPFYLANAFTSDSLAVKTGSTYDSANDWYTTEQTAVKTQSQETSTNNANLPSGGYIAQGFQVSSTDPITRLL